jgi:hypothetical protein
VEGKPDLICEQLGSENVLFVCFLNQVHRLNQPLNAFQSVGEAVFG